MSLIAQNAFFKGGSRTSIDGRQSKSFPVLSYANQAKSSRPNSATQKPDLQVETMKALASLNARLSNQGFLPLHPSLLVTTPEAHHISGTLTEGQGTCLESVLSGILVEFEKRGEMIQKLVQGQGGEVSRR